MNILLVHVTFICIMLLFDCRANGSEDFTNAMLINSGCPETTPINAIKPGLDWEYSTQITQIQEHTLLLCFLKPSQEVSKSILDGHKYDVTLATYSTVERISNIIGVLDTWSGLVSLAYYVHNDTDIIVLEQVLSKATGKDRITTHIVWANEDEPFPINVLRNIANIAIVTSHIFPFDIDFILTENSRELIISYQELLQVAADGSKKSMLVVPALEAFHGVSEEEHHNGMLIEQKFKDSSIETIKSMLISKDLKVFHDHCQKCQGATDINRWLTASEPYDLDSEQYGNIPAEYEPYVILPTKTDGNVFLLWDEIFDGYGRDKTIYYFHLRQFFGYEFTVLPNVGMLHRYHEKSPDATKWRETSGAITARARFYFDRVRWWLMFRKSKSVEFVNSKAATIPTIKPEHLHKSSKGGFLDKIKKHPVTEKMFRSENNCLRLDIIFISCVLFMLISLLAYWTQKKIIGFALLLLFIGSIIQVTYTCV